MVPLTARPNAAASRDDRWNTSTSKMHATATIQLRAGT